MTAPKEQLTDAEALLTLSCQKPDAAPVFISLVQRAPAALQLVKTNPVLFALLAFGVSERALSDDETVALLGRKKRELVRWLGGIDQEAAVKFVERFEVPGNSREFARTMRRVADEYLLRESTARPLSEVFQERRYLEASPELLDLPAFHAELSQRTRTIGPPAASRFIIEIEHLGVLLGRDLSADIARCKSGATLGELRQSLIAEMQASAPDRLADLPGYPRKFPRAAVAPSPTIVPIIDEHDLYLEGRSMNHCVATMVQEFLEGEAFLFRVLAPERATLKLEKKGYRLVVGELKLENNEEPSLATYAAVESWLGGAPPTRSAQKSG